MKRLIATTFSNSLKADPPQRTPSPALPRSPLRKVPGETAFLHHLPKVGKGRMKGKRGYGRPGGHGMKTHLRKVG